MAHPENPSLTVFYDGACPLCAREIAFYRSRKGAARVSWVDVAACAQETVTPGLSKQAALARFHVRHADGRLVSGGAAFTALWVALPGFRLLGRLFQLPPLAWTIDRAYPLFLKVRPRLQRLLPRP